MTKTIVQKITPFLSFDQNAEEAAKFYTSIFKNSKIIDIAYYGKSSCKEYLNKDVHNILSYDLFVLHELIK